MKAVVSRVSRAKLTIDGQPAGGMGRGLLVLLGVKTEDTVEDALYLADKCAALRVFEDGGGKMNLSLSDVSGEMMVVSNFTLCADCARGRRPDFFHAAAPGEAAALYEAFLDRLRAQNVPIHIGKFGADMQIDHVNDGPVSLILDTEQMRKRG